MNLGPDKVGANMSTQGLHLDSGGKRTAVLFHPLFFTGILGNLKYIAILEIFGAWKDASFHFRKGEAKTFLVISMLYSQQVFT